MCSSACSTRGRRTQTSGHSVDIERRQFINRTIWALLIGWFVTVAVLSWGVSILIPGRSPVPPGGYTRTIGTVEATHPSEHNSVRYRYVVNGQVLDGAWFAHGPEGDAGSLRIGQQITVWYEANNPTRSCSCSDPNELRPENDEPAFVEAVVLGLTTLLFLSIGSRVLSGDWLGFIEVAMSIRDRARGSEA
jgi:Protein of unknown function (DUF3592)